MRVLIVDDEVLVALDLEQTLRDAGADVVGPCCTLAQALQTAEREPFDAAVLDVHIGSQTTEGLALALADRHIPCLFYSGQAVPGDLRNRVPEAPVLTKPARQNTLVKAVAELVHS